MNRYNNIAQYQTEGGRKFKRNPLYPTVPPTEDDIYIITTVGDRYDTLAMQFYNDSSLWWIIAASNNYERASLIVKPGIQLRIPADKNQAIQLYNELNSNR